MAVVYECKSCGKRYTNTDAACRALCRYYLQKVVVQAAEVPVADMPEEDTASATILDPDRYTVGILAAAESIHLLGLSL